MRCTTLLILVMLIGACANSTTPDDGGDQATDPYQHFLDIAPPFDYELTPEDAFIRATMGCGQTFPEGTVDHALAIAYADYCE